MKTVNLFTAEDHALMRRMDAAFQDAKEPLRRQLDAVEGQLAHSLKAYAHLEKECSAALRALKYADIEAERSRRCAWGSTVGAAVMFGVALTGWLR